MGLVTLREILASREGYAVGAFNVHNMEYVQGVMKAAEEERAPVILMVGAPMLSYFGMGWITALCRYAADSTDLPVCIHLDHCRDFATIAEALRAGFSSVMFDGSHLPYEDNIIQTRRVVEAAHAVGVSVEGELGAVGGVEDDIESLAGKLTEPQEAKEFVESTGIDALAVAIGNCHGDHKETPKLDFDRLTRIQTVIRCPLVMHGGSGIPDDQVKRSVELGIRKFNVGTELKIAFRSGVEKALEQSESYEVPKVLGPGRQAVAELTREKIRLLGSSGKGG